MKPMSIETQRELVEALETTFVGLALNRDENDLVFDYGMLGLDIIKRTRAALAKARAEMGGDA